MVCRDHRLILPTHPSCQAAYWAAAMSAAMLGAALIGPVVGGLADRFSKRKTMLAVSCCWLPLLLTSAAAVYAGVLRGWMLVPGGAPRWARGGLSNHCVHVLELLSSLDAVQRLAGLTLHQVPSRPTLLC